MESKKELMAAELEKTIAQYWDNYYENKDISHVPIPSQFAPFALQEAGKPDMILEFGCGLGRDSIFFARQGVKTVGFDGSQVAVEKCKMIADAFDINNLMFETCQITTKNLNDIAFEYNMPDKSSQIMVYARFFLHAITEDDEKALLLFLTSALKSGDIFAIEYRTIRDSDLKKVTEFHYRRYINPVILHGKLAAAGFSIKYAVEGFGFAKFGRDDAYAARCIAVKNPE